MVAFTAIYFAFPGRNQPSVQSTVLINNLILNVEIADTKEKRAKGLGGRTSLASDSGMLFTFPETKKHAFWMKGLSFPLDFIWIRGNKIVDITKNVPPVSVGVDDSQIPIYIPLTDVNMVLEVNGGFVDRSGIKVGDVVNVR